MTTFIDQQKENFRKQYGGQRWVYANEVTMEELIEQVIKNTVEEVRVIYAKYSKEEEMDGVGFLNEINQIITTHIGD